MVATATRHDADAALARQLAAHHGVMVSELHRLSTALVDAVDAGSATAAQVALRDWVHAVLIPHAEEEERTIYSAAADLTEATLLIRAMTAEHTLIRATATAMCEATDPAIAGAYGRALFAVFENHQWKENELILPLLVAADTVSLVDLLAADDDHGCGHACH